MTGQKKTHQKEEQRDLEDITEVEEEDIEEVSGESDGDDDSLYDEDPFTQVLISSQGESIPDVLAGIRDSIDALNAVLEKQARILFKICTKLTDT